MLIPSIKEETCIILFHSSSPTVNPGSLIISSQVGGQSGSEEVSHSLQNNQSIITFEILEDNFSDPTCVFWQFSNPYVLKQILL